MANVFKCIKIALIVIHSLSIIVLILCIVVLAIIDKKSVGLRLEREWADEDFGPERKDMNQLFATLLMCVIAISLVIEIIGLVGIIKENLCIVITLFVLSILGTIGNLYSYRIDSAFIGFGISILTGVYAQKIYKKRDTEIRETINLNKI